MINYIGTYSFNLIWYIGMCFIIESIFIESLSDILFWSILSGLIIISKVSYLFEDKIIKSNSIKYIYLSISIFISLSFILLLLAYQNYIYLNKNLYDIFYILPILIIIFSKYDEYKKTN